MERKPIDVQFKVVGHSYKVRWGEIALFVFVTGFFVAVSYKDHNPTASLFAVICAGMWWPLKKAWSALRSRREVSEEQADWLVDKMTRRSEQRPVRGRKLLPHRRDATF